MEKSGKKKIELDYSVRRALRGAVISRIVVASVPEPRNGGVMGNREQTCISPLHLPTSNCRPLGTCTTWGLERPWST